MKIAVFGATGTIGQRIVNEALSRGHEVIAISRDPSRIQKREHLEARQGELMDVASITAAVQGADAVVSSFGPTKPEDTTLYGPIGKNLVAGSNGRGGVSAPVRRRGGKPGNCSGQALIRHRGVSRRLAPPGGGA